MTLGPVMLDLEGTVLTLSEREMLRHPGVGGVILFSRNYESIEQLQYLVCSIHELRDPHLLVAVDHEGGRVQRFRVGFTRLPPTAAFGLEFDQHPQRGRKLAEQGGWLMAAELRAVGIDFSFAPVLDLQHGISSVIGDRAFHRYPIQVIALARAYIHGMRSAGMQAVGKHFPGHGGVREDSHLTLPEDPRSLDCLWEEDIRPFRELAHGELAGIMPAHVRYSAVDDLPGCFSQYWLQTLLRNGLGFQGAIFSDDLSMAGAKLMGDFPTRAKAALTAGCDMVLICNHPDGVMGVLDHLGDYDNPAARVRLARLHGRGKFPDPTRLQMDNRWQDARQAMASLMRDHDPELDV